MSNLGQQGQPNPYSYKASPIEVSGKDVFQHHEQKKHGWLGIISFVISLVSGFGFFVMIIFAAVVGTNPEIIEDETHPMVIIIGLAAIGLTIMAFVAMAIGLVSLFMPNQKKLFGILGLVFSMMLVAFSVVLFVIGSVN